MKQIGDTITLTKALGGHTPCPRCSSSEFIIEPGKGPHALGLRCAGCRGSYRWLSKIGAGILGLRKLDGTSKPEDAEEISIGVDPDSIEVDDGRLPWDETP